MPEEWQCFFLVSSLTMRDSFKDGLALCALLHLAEPASFQWTAVVAETPLERCTRGLSGFETRFHVPKLMDPEDIVSVPDDKGMTLYLSYIVDILQRKSPMKKSALSAVRQPDRRQSAPNIAPSSHSASAIPSVKPKYGGGGFIGSSPSPKRAAESAPIKRGVPDLPRNSSPSPPAVVPPMVVVPAPDTDDRVHELQLKLKAKDAEIEALTEGMRLMEVALEKKDKERKDAEDKLQRELREAIALAASKGGDGADSNTKAAMTELKAQVDELEQHNQMLQMSLEDSRQSQRKMEESVKRKQSSSSLLVVPKQVDAVEDAEEEQELLRHELREAERRAVDAERELKKLKEAGGTVGTPGAGREQRLKTQVGELEERITTLEKEGRALKRAADKAARLEKELAEMEERDLKHAQEARELKKLLNKANQELEELRAPSAPALERGKSGSRLVRSPREKLIPKMTEDSLAPNSSSRPLPASPRK